MKHYARAVAIAAACTWGGGAAAVTVDILAVGDTGTITGTPGGTALLFGSELDSGIGSAKSFLDLRQSGGSGPEKGYNTTGALEFETQAATAVPLSDLALVEIGGTEYYEFGLSSNQTGGTTTISIEEIQLFQASSSSLSGYNTGTRSLAGATEIFDWMAAATEHVVLEDINGGSSSLDLLVYVPRSVFLADEFVYFFTSMGGNVAANNGEERWVNAKGDSAFCLDDSNVDCIVPPSVIPTPEPGVAALLACGLLGLAIASGLRRRSTHNVATS